MTTKLAALWLAYMAANGAFFPFFPLFLSEQLKLSASQIGWVTAMVPLAGLLAQPLWGHGADRSGARRTLLAVAIAGVALAYLTLAQASNFASAIAGTIFLALFSTAVIPMKTAISFAALPGGRQDFGPVRAWGTVGFLLAVLIVPWAIQSSQGLRYERLFFVGASFAALALVLTLTLPHLETLSTRSRKGDLRRLLGTASTLRLLIFALLAHLAVQSPIQLLPLLVAERGGNASDLGRLWIAMLVVEFPVIFFAGRTLSRFGARGLLTIGLGSEALRWLITALIDDRATLIAVQLLHGIGVMGVLIGLPLYIEASVPPQLRSSGQTLISAIGFGLGSILSLIVGGWLFDQAGPTTPFLSCGVLALVLAATVNLWLPRPPAESE